VAELAVINASPLIFLSRSGYMDLLGHIADRILLPEPVADEILARSPSDVSAKVIENKRRWDRL
jgi:hypothetical protein